MLAQAHWNEERSVRKAAAKKSVSQAKSNRKIESLSLWELVVLKKFEFGRNVNCGKREISSWCVKRLQTWQKNGCEKELRWEALRVKLISNYEINGVLVQQTITSRETFDLCGSRTPVDPTWSDGLLPSPPLLREVFSIWAVLPKSPPTILTRGVYFWFFQCLAEKLLPGILTDEVKVLLVRDWASDIETGQSEGLSLQMFQKSLIKITAVMCETGTLSEAARFVSTMRCVILSKGPPSDNLPYYTQFDIEPGALKKAVHTLLLPLKTVPIQPALVSTIAARCVLVASDPCSEDVMRLWETEVRLNGAVKAVKDKSLALSLKIESAVSHSPLRVGKTVKGRVVLENGLGTSCPLPDLVPFCFNTSWRRLTKFCVRSRSSTVSRKPSRQAADMDGGDHTPQFFFRSRDHFLSNRRLPPIESCARADSPATPKNRGKYEVAVAPRCDSPSSSSFLPMTFRHTPSPFGPMGRVVPVRAAVHG